MLEKLYYAGLLSLAIGFILPTIFLKSGKIQRRLSIFASLVGISLLGVLSIDIFYQNQSLSLVLYEIFKNISISMYIDRLAAFFILIIAAVAFAVEIFSIGYIEHFESQARKNALLAIMNLFVLSMVLVVSSKSMLSFLVFWEIMSLSSFFLVYFDYDKIETRKAGIFYLVMTQLSTILLIAAFVIVYNGSGSFDISSVKLSSAMASLGFVLAFLGFGIKAGVIPFHKWLPYAHPSAPSNISALMSGLMIKVAIYGMMRFLIFVFGVKALWWGILILVIGTISAILGVIYALKEHDIKRLLAYHSIENIGIILIGLGLYAIFTVNNIHSIAMLALIGSLFHTLNHALFKSLLFLTAGSVVMETGIKNIEEMGGLIKTMPATAFLFLVGAISISALPPFNGFVSELMIFQSFFSAHLLSSPLLQIVLVVSFCILALTSALAAACFVKAFSIIFLANPRSKHATEAKEVGFSMILGPSLIALLCALLGIFSFQIFLSLGYDFAVPNLLFIGAMLIFFYLIAFLAFLEAGKTRISETWACGFPISGGKTEYTASGFSEPIVTIFKGIYRPKIQSEMQYHDKDHAIVESGHVEMTLMKFFEEYLYNPIIKFMGIVSKLIARLQSNNLGTYLSYIFAASLVLVAIMRFLI